MFKEEKKAITSWWSYALLLVGGTAFILTIMSYLGLFTGTVIERKIFENSYQYSEARKTAVATFEAQLAEVQAQLTNPKLTEDEVRNLEAQAAMLRVQLRTERSKQ